MTKTDMFTLRVATAADREPIGRLHALSMRRLAAGFYDAEAIEAFLSLGTIDEALLGGGSYYVMSVGGMIVGTGGWSTRTAHFEAHRQGSTTPRAPSGPSVRGVFVHPDCARCGVARQIMDRIELDIVDAGFPIARLTSTLPGIPFYRSLGWRSGPPAVLNLPGDLLMVGMDMTKHLPAGPATGRCRTGVPPGRPPRMPSVAR